MTALKKILDALLEGIDSSIKIEGLNDSHIFNNTQYGWVTSYLRNSGASQNLLDRIAQERNSLQTGMNVDTRLGGALAVGLRDGDFFEGSLMANPEYGNYRPSHRLASEVTRQFHNAGYSPTYSADMGVRAYEMAEAVGYNGSGPLSPSAELSPEDFTGALSPQDLASKPYSSKRVDQFEFNEKKPLAEAITDYIDTFRDQVELSGVRGGRSIDLSIDDISEFNDVGDITIGGIPEGAELSVGSTNAAVTKNSRQKNVQQAKNNFLDGQVQSFPSSSTLRNKARNRGKIDLTRQASTPSPSRKSSMANAHQKNLDERYGYTSVDDPETEHNDIGFDSFGGWMNAARDALSTNWHGNPNKNPNRSVVDVSTSNRVGTPIGEWEKAQKVTDLAVAKQQKQNRQALAEQEKTQTQISSQSSVETEDEDVVETPSTRRSKAGLLGESVSTTAPKALGQLGAASATFASNVQANRKSRSQAASNRTPANDQDYTPSAEARAAVDQISMGKEGAAGRSTGYNDRQGLASALSKSGKHGDVSVSDLTSHGTIRGSEQSDMLAEQDLGLGDSGGGGDNTRVICTELVRQGLMASSLQRLDIAYTLRELSPATVRGYHAWAVPYVRLMKRSNLATRLVEPFARWRAEEIAYQMKARSRPHYGGKVVRVLGEPVCWALGKVLGWIGDPGRFYPNFR